MILLVYLLICYDSFVIGPLTQLAWLLFFSVELLFWIGGLWYTFKEWKKMTRKDRLQALFLVVL